MLVFYKERLAFLAVPKTGSTAYHSALSDRADIVVSDPPDLKHAPVRRYDRFFQNIFRKMYDTELEIMAVVREPIDWLGSWYKFRSRQDRIGHPHSTRDLSFDEFVQAYMQNPRPEFADVGSQSPVFQDQKQWVWGKSCLQIRKSGQNPRFPAGSAEHANRPQAGKTSHHTESYRCCQRPS